ncbi:MAG: carboxylating nicotinate-nucleotide diphosphorylase [Anaerovoracaceae bacterium]|jgi:nicotinate-nucleotide pyrophosphorylase (carboxylating)
MNNGLLIKMRKTIELALLEDMDHGDHSSWGIFDETQKATVDLTAKEDGILCGIQVFAETFYLLDPETEVQLFSHDGDAIQKGDLIGKVTGTVPTLLSAERVALNFLGRMSGIATATGKMAKRLDGTKTRITDTRKTAPGLRIFDKYAVTVGGGVNHRYNLSSGVMLKDNHIAAAGSIKKAVEKVREKVSFMTKIEVEAENLDMVKEALETGCDVIMLDNMDVPTMKEAVDLIGDRALVEISGNVTEENLSTYANLGADVISSGAITHSVKVLDLSMKNMRILEGR